MSNQLVNKISSHATRNPGLFKTAEIEQKVISKFNEYCSEKLIEFEPENVKENFLIASNETVKIPTKEQ